MQPHGRVASPESVHYLTCLDACGASQVVTMSRQLLALALAPALSMGFVPTPTSLSFWGVQSGVEGQCRERTCGRVSMTRVGVQEKMERVYLRNAILAKDKHGYQVVMDETEYDESQVQVQDDGPEAEVFSQMELQALYGGSKPFQQDDVAGSLGDFQMPAFGRGDVIKGIVVGTACICVCCVFKKSCPASALYCLVCFVH